MFEGDRAGLQAAYRIARDRELTLAPFVHAVFATGHDEANSAVFRAQPADDLDLVGIALRGPKKAVDKAVKGLSLHP